MLSKTTLAAHVSAAIALAICAGTFAAHATEAPTNVTVPLDPAMTRIEPAESPTLFPRLLLEDFPDVPDAVRFQVLEQDGDDVRIAAFHRRGVRTGFAGIIEARRELDERSGLRRVTLTRMDQDCIAEAERLKLAPQALCASVTANQLMRGAQELTFRHPYLNHQLRITMTQSRDRDGLWSLVPMHRLGEPALLHLELDDGGDGTLVTRWQIADATERSDFRRELGAEIRLRDFEASGLDAFELALLSSLSFFDDLSDLHRPWVAYSFETDTLEQPPSADDEDIYGCEAAEGVCSAEYDTCIPTPDGWLGCNHDPRESGWGNGFGEDAGLGNGNGNGNGNGTITGPNTWLDPDWQVGSFRTTPKFPRPLFHGLEPYADDTGKTTHYGLTYDITSVLQVAATEPRVTSAAAMGEVARAAHIVFIYMHWYQPPGGDYICGGYQYMSYVTAASLQPGDYENYSSTPHNAGSDDEFICNRPDPGVYELNYSLDPHNLWNEGPDGEMNNQGKFRGYHLETGS